MAQDTIARGLGSRALKSLPPTLEAFGGGAGAASWRNREAFRDAFAAQTRTISLSGGSYACETIPTTEAITLKWTGPQPSVIVGQGVSVIDGVRSELVATSSASRGIVNAPNATWAWPKTESYLAADVAAGAMTLTLEAGQGANWAVGDELLYKFGSLPYDFPEPVTWGFAKVRSKAGDVLTLDRPIPVSFALTEVSGKSYTDSFGVTGRFNKTIAKMAMVGGFELRNLTVIGAAGTNTHHAINVFGGRDINVRSCGARNVGAGVFLQYVEGGIIEDCRIEDSNNAIGAWAGRALTIAECRDIQVRGVQAKGVKKYIFVEANSTVRVQGGIFENTGDPATGASFGAGAIVFHCLGRSNLAVSDFTITGHGGYSLSENYTADPAFLGAIRFEGTLSMTHPIEPNYINLDELNCLLDYRIGNTRQVWDFQRPQVWRRRIWLRNGMTQDFYGPTGAIRTARVYTSSGLTLGAGNKLSGFYIGKVANEGVNRTGSLAAGQTKSIPFYGGTLGGISWTGRSTQTRLRVTTASGTDIDAASEYLDVEIEYAIDRFNPDFAWSSQNDEMNSGPGGNLREAYFATQDLANIAAGATLQVDLAIPAMAVGDIVEGVSFGYALAGLSIRSMEAIAGACRVVFENQTGAAIDKPATAVRVLWRKPLASG